MSLSCGRMPDSQSREPGSNPPLLAFQSLGIFVLSTTPQFTYLAIYKNVVEMLINNLHA